MSQQNKLERLRKVIREGFGFFDKVGNATVFPNGGTLLTEDAGGVLAYSSEPQVIAVLGLEDVLVVRTADAVLVAPRERSEEVKKFVERLRDMGRDDVL